MLVNRWSKVLGYLPNDSASVAPPWTSAAMRAVTSRSVLESFCSDRICRHWAIGRPASIIVENWRGENRGGPSLTPPPAVFGIPRPAGALPPLLRHAAAGAP